MKNLVIKIGGSLLFDEKKELTDELHKYMVGWLLKNFFSADNNPEGYEEKIKAIYYDTLNARNLAYQDPNNDNKEVYGEILKEEFREEGFKVDREFFDTVSEEVITKLDEATCLFEK